MTTPVKTTSVRRKVFGFLGALVAIAFIAGGVVLIRAQMAKPGEHTGTGDDGWLHAIQNGIQVAIDPKAGFPGKDRVNILCMGIDDNWTNGDEVYTAGARTDTLFMLSLDMANKKASILSIPRDGYVPIAGTDYKTKINSAYASGGPARAEATVANLLGVTPDYYIVIKIDGTKKMVDALGGVDLDVEHQMDYDDQWGHLHVHLKPGFQHLSGDDAVGFARYRHGNKGVTPEDGDERRIYRQHVLVRAMVDRMKNLGNLTKPDELIDTAMSCIETDMTRTQLFDLGAIFHSVQQDDIQTALIPGTDGKGDHGAYVMLLDPAKTQLLTDWLLKGDPTAGRAVTDVLVKNGTTVNGLALATANSLQTKGYTSAKASGNYKFTNVATTQIIDTGVPNHASAEEIAGFLGIPTSQVVHEKPQPNKMGWTPPPAVTIILGSDYAAHAPAPAAAAAPATTPVAGGG